MGVEFSMIKLTEAPTTANLTTEVQEVWVDPNAVFAVKYLPQHKCTAVMAVGGAYMPVQESVKDVVKMLEQANNKNHEEVKNG